ncbi:MAG: ATP-binding protein [Deltaproteobacteria bacterium]|nr:ATP-binding protein [Deltaproteobacteria bacterium]
MIDRAIFERLRRGKKSVLLLGARQVGKSTLLHRLHPTLNINLADQEEFLRYARDPGLLRRRVAAVPRAALVVIDEVQRLPALLNSVQALLDEAPARRVLLTGSSARKLKRGGANLLPGRILLEYLDPLSFWELGDAFDLDRALRVGTLPGIDLEHEQGDAVFGTYATVYLREEIQAEALTKDVGTYARFLDLAAEASGQWINYSKLASDGEIPKETVRRFFSILEDTLIVHRIPSFQPKWSLRRVSQRDRFIFFDLGVRNAILGVHRHTVTPVERGARFEQWFILQCLSYARAHRREWRASAYRTEAGVEVDLVLDTGRALLAIECKSGSKTSARDLGGLRSFADIAHKPVQRYLVYGGTHRERFPDGTLAVPYGTFLREILPAVRS